METLTPPFGEDGLATWRMILEAHQKKRDRQVCDLFLEGVRILKLNENHVPDLAQVNKVLERCSGFRGVFVDGLKDGRDFYQMLAERKFPVGNFIRDSRDLSYTPAPDLVHDLYGHLPFYTDRAYGDFCHRFGIEASRFFDRPELLAQFERFFWFTIEFGLIKTSKGIRIFGAGIASSTAECDYALSGVPEVVPFDVDRIRGQEFRIDVMQPRLFLLESVEQLCGSLDELVRKVKSEAYL